MRLPSRFFPALIAVASLCFCRPIPAQTSEADISARLIGKTVYMRGFWASDKLKFDASGNPEGSPAAGSPTVAGLNIDKVNISGHKLRLEGQRVGVTFDKDGVITSVPLNLGTKSGQTPKPERVSIEIEGTGSGDFKPALDAIFAMNFAELAPEMPNVWQIYAQSHFLTGQNVTAASSGAMPPKAKDGEVAHAGSGVKPARITYSVEPEFSEIARRMKYAGNVQVYCWVEVDGTTSHVRIARPAGMGLDEQAVKSVEQYRFQPATRDGQPVRVEIHIEVNFQIF